MANQKNSAQDSLKGTFNRNSKPSLNNKVFKSRPDKRNSESSENANKFKVLAPKTETLLKNRITERIIKNKKNSLTPFGFFKVGGLNPSKWHKRINYLIFKWQIWHKFNRLVIRFIISSSLFFLIYLSFFDTHFLVNNYKIVLSPGSYLSPQQTTKLTSHLAKTRLLGFIPVNQYWFLNDYTLTVSSQEVVEEISLIQVNKRIWPNEVELEVFTEPILLTLSIDLNGLREYWQITPKGRVFGQDLASIRENVVHVERSVTITNLVGVDQSTNSFSQIDFSQDPVQLNRLWFARWITNQLKDKLEISKVSFPSLNDTEVIVTTSSGTKLMFETDTEVIAVENQQRRIQGVLNSTLLDDIINNKVAYIDFRSSTKRVFVCEINQVCDE